MRTVRGPGLCVRASLSKSSPTNNIGELKCCIECSFMRGGQRGTLTITLQEACDNKLLEHLIITPASSIPACSSTEPRPRKEDEAENEEQFREGSEALCAWSSLMEEESFAMDDGVKMLQFVSWALNFCSEAISRSVPLLSRVTKEP